MAQNRSMDIPQWLWCVKCERAFKVLLSEVFNELELQLGVEHDGKVYTECPYDGCDGGPTGFWAWENVRSDRIPLYPELPEEGTVYPMKPDGSARSEDDWDCNTWK